MSAVALRCLSYVLIAFALFAGILVWAYRQPVDSPVFARVQPAGKQIAKAPVQWLAPFAQQPAAPKVEDPPPINDPPRFFPKGIKGGGNGFLKKARATLSERMGVRLERPSEDTILQLGLADTDGLIVEEVRGGSAAEKAGLKVGDILLTLDGLNVPSDVDQFHFQLENLKSSEPLGTVLMRDGKMETLKGLVLPEPAQLRPFPGPRRPFDGGNRFDISFLPLS